MADPVVGIIMGSSSDEPTMEKGCAILDELQIPYDMIVCSAHRNPERTAEYASTAKARGLKVIIAGAGLAAALPGVVAAHTTLPVIGVPCASGALNGVDALYAIVQMPPGVPVATVGIDNARNAAVLAAQILALSDEDIQERLQAYKDALGG
ncbi:MAG: 5-(carboxyamino)imidazole ribonucleotide mutase [Gemmatimonadetes bacterium]|nr:5-(carboxyamino)imidazole ribonucleotide mutase [Gemmatimonadota bacterium]MYF18722.1 5-(carboxyamino)imidazole ribonucleotide mutase [Gemmatimonadota bacterium]